jgi:hypothetical protein
MIMDARGPCGKLPRNADYIVIPKGIRSPVIDVDEDPPGRDTWVGYHRDLKRLARVRALLDLVIARLAN